MPLGTLPQSIRNANHQYDERPGIGSARVAMAPRTPPMSGKISLDWPRTYTRQAFAAFSVQTFTKSSTSTVPRSHRSHCMGPYSRSEPRAYPVLHQQVEPLLIPCSGDNQPRGGIDDLLAPAETCATACCPSPCPSAAEHGHPIDQIFQKGAAEIRFAVRVQSGCTQLVRKGMA